MPLNVFALALVGTAVLTVNTAARSDTAAIAERFTPSVLTDAAAAAKRGFHSGKLEIATATTPDDRHSRLIIAVYSNGRAAAVRALTSKGETWIVADEIAIPTLVSEPSVTYNELLGIGHDVFIAQLRTGPRGQACDWIFRWTGARLENITPTESDVDSRRNGAPAGLTIEGIVPDGHGGKDLIVRRQAPNPDADTDPDTSRYVPMLASAHFDGTVYRIGREVTAYLEFPLSGAAVPDTQTETFVVTNTRQRYEVTLILSGHTNPSGTELQVSLNGVVVAHKDDLMMSGGINQITVELLPKNAVSVHVARPGIQRSLDPNDKSDGAAAELSVLVRPKSTG